MKVICVRPIDQKRACDIASKLCGYSRDVRRLPGIPDEETVSVLTAQIVDSLRRIEYVWFVRDSRIDAERANPSNPIFDPIRAAVYYMRQGEIDEAIWLIFLSTHFGKHSKDGWRLVRDVYGALGGETWTWEKISRDPHAFRAWLELNERRLRSDGISRRFSNHRKYESLSARSQAGTAAVIESYVSWVAPPRTHQQMFRDVHSVVGQNPKDVFRYLYSSMKTVKRFGRLGKFDFLTMLGKLGLAPIAPDSAYLSEATGPLRGARLLFGGANDAPIRAEELEQRLAELDLVFDFGMQVWEDALCNWQKSPRRYLYFRG